MIILKHLSKSFGKEPVLNAISVQFQQGESTCIVGKNGSGKSTLLSIMAGLTLGDEGEVLYGSNNLPPYKAPLSFLPQKDHLFTDLSVKDNLWFWAAAAGQSFSSPTVVEALELFRLGDFLNKKVTQLSGGMRQRVALCTTLFSNPSYLLLDEPFTGLDLIHKREIASYLVSLSRLGKTIIYTAHNVDEVYLMANQLFVLKHNKLAPLPMQQDLTALHQLIISTLEGEQL